MSWEFSFSTQLHLSEDHWGLRLPIALSAGSQEVRLDAYFDTGSTYCVVPREAGERLGLDVEAGTFTTLRTGGGPMPGYLHHITLTIGDLTFEDVPLCVAKYQGLDHCLLGRAGWLQKVRLNLIAYDEHPYLNLHGQWQGAVTPIACLNKSNQSSFNPASDSQLESGLPGNGSANCLVCAASAT